MIIKELLSRGEAGRILVICPAGLTVNWQNEMKDGFRIFFDIFGRDFSDANPLYKEDPYKPKQKGLTRTNLKNITGIILQVIFNWLQ